MKVATVIAVSAAVVSGVAAQGAPVTPDFTALKFPSGKPLPIEASSNWRGETFKVPQPPYAPVWTNEVIKMSASTNGIPALPPRADVNTNTFDLDEASQTFKCPTGTWSISFDDGPKELTPQFVDLLRRNDATATFFVLGANVVNNPQWASNLKAAYDAGHQIGLHSWTHRAMSNLTNDQFVSEFVWNALAVKQVIGRIPRYVRPPYGDRDERTKAIMRAMGFKIMIWSFDSQDTAIPAGDVVSPGSWNVVNATGMFRRVIANGTLGLNSISDVRGYMSLQHDLTAEQLRVATEVVPLIKENRFRTVSSAYCATNGARDTPEEWYFGDNEPFAKLVSSIELPVTKTELYDAVTGKKINSGTKSVVVSTGVLVGALMGLVSSLFM
ncbi:chitin deacetylase [Chytridiales sp. JEL 0842]|nr:chitin deacetylase [Chytridiales sp. JEL 0842]